MRLTSPAFSDGAEIPSHFTCDGRDVSPPLEWTDPPAGTKSLALIVDDPDAPAGTWTHWVLHGMAPAVRTLAEGAGNGGPLPPGSAEGRNTGKGTGYDGPCPPGGTHRYFFRLFALDRELGLGSNVTAEALNKAMDGHVLARAELMGRYARRPR